MLVSKNLASQGEADFFSDDVVINFPSLARAIERMRRPFVERDKVVMALVHLTLREAEDGAIVPVDAPVRRLCRSCRGHGETWTEICHCCEGSGTEIGHHRVQVALPASLADGARFYFTVNQRHEPPTQVELCVVVD
jgi:DnaJ-class molecular chaperone